jgi:predicted PP-loop superfamily ATPase
VALSGGVDSSFSLILAKKLGFNPIAVTVDPGTIILPNQFKKNIRILTESLDIHHEYIESDYSNIIKESFTGNVHPCGRCSKNTGELVKKYAKDNEIPIIIFGDMLATGSQCINLQEDSLYRLNLPASLSVGKQEIKSLIRNYNLKEFKGFGCPLLYEVHRKFPHMKKFSIQRILRETRSGALEPGEALDLIWSFYKTKK